MGHLWKAGDSVGPTRVKPAHRRASGWIRFGNDIGLSVSDKPLSHFFEIFLMAQLIMGYRAAEASTPKTTITTPVDWMPSFSDQSLAPRPSSPASRECGARGWDESTGIPICRLWLVLPCAAKNQWPERDRS